MKLWKKSTTSALGIDIGSSSIKIVELTSEGGRAKLVTYGVAEDVGELLHREGEEGIKVIGTIIKDTVKAARSFQPRAIGGLPNYAIFSATVTLPAMPKSDLAGAVKWEAGKVVPMPIEEVVLDWQVVREKSEEKTKKEGEAQEAEKVIEVLLTAAPKKLVERYMAIIKAAGLEFASLETESFASARSLVGFDPTPMMLLDLGGSVTSLSVIADQIPVLQRSVDTGGESITEAIANVLGVERRRAEAFKRDLGASSDPSQFLQGAPKAINDALATITNEIRYLLDLYEREGTRKIEKIILTGGTALLPHLADSLGKALERRVFLGDPWARVIVPTELKPLLDEIGPRFSVAIGLAMRGLT